MVSVCLESVNVGCVISGLDRVKGIITKLSWDAISAQADRNSTVPADPYRHYALLIKQAFECTNFLLQFTYMHANTQSCTYPQISEELTVKYSSGSHTYWHADPVPCSNLHGAYSTLNIINYAILLHHKYLCIKQMDRLLFLHWLASEEGRCCINSTMA